MDPVRFLSNHSTGKMGYAIAKMAARRGADVTLVSGETALEKPVFVQTVPVKSAGEMFDAVTQRAPEQDIIIKAAAVADYRPKVTSSQKVKKAEGELVLELERTQDILAYLGGHRQPGQILCGFAMETEDLLENARKKLEKKHLDMIVANSLRVEGAGFGGDTNVVTLVTGSEEISLGKLSKEETAGKILDRIMELREAK